MKKGDMVIIKHPGVRLSPVRLVGEDSCVTTNGPSVKGPSTGIVLFLTRKVYFDNEIRVERRGAKSDIAIMLFSGIVVAEYVRYLGSLEVVQKIEVVSHQPDLGGQE